MQAPAQRQNEPRVTLFAADPGRMEGFGTIEGSSGEVTLDGLSPGEAYLNEEAASELGVATGDGVLVFAGGRPPLQVTVKDVVSYEGAGTDGSAVLMPLEQAQAFLGRSDRARHILLSNSGDEWSGAGLSDEVVKTLEPVLGPLGLDIDESKQDAIEAADLQGNSFMAFFTTFGSFSIAAGILLIFLVFVMLATERRGELGIARAIGTRRGHLVQTFTFEGAAYDLIAALVGALVGAAVAFLMVLVMSRAFNTAAGGDFEIEFAVKPRSLAIAYALGVLLTLAVVAVSAWRVSTMTISAAIRNLPEPHAPRRRRRLALAAAGLSLGGLLTLSGVTGDAATPAMMGVSLMIVSLVPVLRALGVSERIAFTSCGLAVSWSPAAPVGALGAGAGPALDELLDLDRRRAHDRRRRGLGDRLQRRPAARARHADLRPDPQPRADPQDLDGLPAGQPLPDGHDPRHVHARRLYARDRRSLERLVHERHRQEETFGGGFNVGRARAGRHP